MLLAYTGVLGMEVGDELLVSFLHIKMVWFPTLYLHLKMVQFRTS